MRLRELQDETGGFTAFITWSYQPEHTELGGGEATGLEYLRMLALARIVLDNFPSLQASWVTQGGKVGQLSLAYGANDMGSVMIEENVVRAAGASYCMDEVEIVRNIENAGFVAKRRNMHYDILGDPFFRERDVPRQLDARDRARRRRHQPSRGAERTTPPAARPKSKLRVRIGRTSSTEHSAPSTKMIRYRAAWVLPISGRRSPGGIVTRRSRRHHRASARTTAGAVEDLGDVAILPGPGQRAYPSRAVVDARPGAAVHVDVDAGVGRGR